MNLLDQLPKRLWKEARKRLHEMYEAPTRRECTRLRDAYCTQLRAQGQAPAAACLERDWEDFTTVYDFPQEYWTHLRTTNPIESAFDGVRLRTNATKRMQVRENALYLIFKLVLRLSLNWRAVNAPNHLRLLMDGHRYVDVNSSSSSASEGRQGRVDPAIMLGGISTALDKSSPKSIGADRPQNIQAQTRVARRIDSSGSLSHRSRQRNCHQGRSAL